MNENTPIAEAFRPGKEVWIEVVNYYGNKIIIKATVLQMDDHHLIVNLSKQEGIFNQVNVNADVRVICKKDRDFGTSEVPQDRDFAFCSKFIKVKEAEPPQVILSRPAASESGASMRHSSENKVSLPFSYFLNDQEIKDGVVKTLTCIGLIASIKTDDLLEVGLGLLFKLSLPTSPTPFLMMGTITKLTPEAGQTLITLDFSHIPNNLQDQIAKYLFSLRNSDAQKEQHQKAAFIKIK